MANSVSLYKGFVIKPIRGNFSVFDYAGKLKITFPSQRQARDYIDSCNIAALRKTKKNPCHKNPLTKSETRRVRAESAIHKKIGGKPVKRAYYRGVAEGMKDIAEQYGENPRLKNDLGVYRERSMSGRYVFAAFTKRAYDLFHNNGFNIYHSFPKAKAEYLIKLAKGSGLRVVSIDVELPDSFLRSNPTATEIYSRIKEIIAVKGPGHRCDAACKRARHTYKHVFSSPARVLGLGNGDILIKSN